MSQKIQQNLVWGGKKKIFSSFRCPNNAFFLFFIWDWTNKHTAATSLFYDFCTCNLEKNNFAEMLRTWSVASFFCKYKVVRQKSKVWSATVDSFAKLIYDHIMFGRHAFQLSGSSKMAKSWSEKCFFQQKLPISRAWIRLDCSLFSWFHELCNNVP